MNGLLISCKENIVGMAVSPSEIGLKNRTMLVEDIQKELDYCQLSRNDYLITGSSVISAELDRIGGQEANKVFFVMSLLVSLCVLYLYLRNVKAALASG